MTASSSWNQLGSFVFEHEGPVVGERGETTVKAESWLQDVLGGWQQAQGRGSGPCHRWSVASGRFLCPRSCPQRPPISVLPGTRQMLSGADQAGWRPTHNPEGAGPPSSGSPPVKWENQIQLLRAVVTTRNLTHTHTHKHTHTHTHTHTLVVAALITTVLPSFTFGEHRLRCISILAVGSFFRNSLPAYYKFAGIRCIIHPFWYVKVCFCYFKVMIKSGSNAVSLCFPADWVFQGALIHSLTSEDFSTNLYLERAFWNLGWGGSDNTSLAQHARVDQYFARQGRPVDACSVVNINWHYFLVYSVTDSTAH